MFNFKNNYEPRKKWDPNDPSTWANKGLSGLSKYWRYTTLDAQNNNNFNNNNSNIQTSNINNYNVNQGNCTSPDDITLEISYDNFYTLGVDMMKKKKYAEELRKQIEEKQMRKKLERQKKKLDDLNDDIRIEKERKMIEDRQRQNNNRSLPKINITPYYPPQKVQQPVKIYTPPPPPPPMPIINKNKTPSKPRLNMDFISNYSYEAPPKIQYIYRKVHNTEETKSFLRDRENELEKFNRDMEDQLKMLRNDFDSGMKQLNDEVNNLNNGLGNRNHNFRYLISQKINEISADIQNSNNKKSNIQTEHIYNVIRKSKDGKMTIQRFMGNPDLIHLPINDNQYIIKKSNLFDGESFNVFNENNVLYDEITSNSMKLPYINLSHCISYS